MSIWINDSLVWNNNVDVIKVVQNWSGNNVVSVVITSNQSIFAQKDILQQGRSGDNADVWALNASVLNSYRGQRKNRAYSLARVPKP
jgi:hypothetical protein